MAARIAEVKYLLNETIYVVKLTRYFFNFGSHDKEYPDF